MAKKTDPAPQLPPLPATFEAGMEELETLVEALSSDALPLEQLIDRYERGTQLLGFCRERIQQVKLRVELIQRREQGMTLEPFDPAAAAANNDAPASAPAGSARSSQTPRPPRRESPPHLDDEIRLF